MNRNESFPASQVTELVVHLAWASLEMMTDDVETVQVLVSGDANDVGDLKITFAEGKLLVEQPTYGLSIKLTTERWMQLCLRIPKTWKGAVEASTIAGMLNTRGLAGTDLSLDTVSGDLRATNLSGINLTLKTVTGDIRGGGLTGDKLGIRTVSGNVQLQQCQAGGIKLSGVSGSQSLELTQAFERIEITTVSGDVKLYAPLDKVDAVLRGVTGRIKTSGISVNEGAPVIRANSVSGDLEIISTIK